MVLLATQRLPSPRAAAKYLRERHTEAKKCAKDGGGAGPLYARRGAIVVNAATMSMEGDDSPSISKTVALTRLALRTAR